MGEDDQRAEKGGLPSWQLKASETSREVKKDNSETLAQEPPSRASIIETARRFLEEDEVRNASTDKQVAFLEDKGLESHEIESLLGISRNTEATTSQPESTTPSQAKPISPSIPQPSKPSSLSPITHDAPPIITYPEFLTTPTQPPPLITAKRLLTTLYFFGGISALLYGTSNYLVVPMVASLTESRHTLAETAQINLDKLVSRLSELVSELPQASSQIPYKDDVSDSDSDSDPTELFHRDIGVQTSLPTSPVDSRPGTPISSTLEDQTMRLTELSNNIKELSETSTSEGSAASDISTSIGVLREYLDSIAYTPNIYKYAGMTASSRATEESMDEIARLKKEIRGVKGVLLNARSFPGGSGGVSKVGRYVT